MTIALATAVLNDGDAIGNDVRGMAAALRADGHDVAFFAEKARVEEEVVPLEELAAFLRDGDNAVIYHHSQACDAAKIVERHRRQAVVKFHNVTPPRFFAGLDADAVRACEAGRRQAVQLARAGVPFWADSAFNARDLAADVPGFHADELPPFHQAEALLDTPPDASLPGLDDWATTLLCVGRVAPNKNLELAVETLAEAKRHDPSARLIVAGGHVYADYTERVTRRAESLGVADSLVVTGHVTAAQLKALYLASDLLLVTSDHEGFCVPLVEAMALGVPVVGVPRTAVPDTGGDAVRYANDAPTLVAAVREMIEDAANREKHLRHGRRRYRERFSTAAIADHFRELVARQFAACAV